MEQLSTTFAVLGDPAELARALFEGSNDAMFIFKPDDGRLCDANPMAERCTQLPRKKLLSKSIDELVLAESPGAIHELMSACRATRVFHSRAKYSLKRCTGDPLPIDIQVSRIQVDPAPLGLLVVRDISQRKQAEEQLQVARARQQMAEELTDRQRRLNLVVNNVSASIAFVDASEQYQFVNDRYCEMVGLPRAKIIGNSVHSVIGDETYRHILPHMRRVLAGEHQRFETTLHIDHRDPIWIDVNCVPDVSTTGQVQGCYVLILDITHRMEMEQALRESEAKFRVLSEDSSAVIFIVREDRFAYVNPTMEEITGYELSELHELHVSDIIHPDHRDLVLQRGQRRLLGEEVPTHYEIKFLHRSGQERWATLSAAVVDYEGQKSVLCTATDVTERKWVEDRLRVQHEVLEKIATGTELTETLNALCIAIEKIVPNSVCSVLLFDESDGTLRFVAGPTLSGSMIAAIDGISPGEFAGSCGTAAYLGEAVFVTDTFSDARWADLRDAATELGIRGCWSVPICSEQRIVLGTFAISHTDVKCPNDSHRELLLTASPLAGIAVQRKKAEKLLSESEQRYRTLVENATEAIFVLDVEQGRFVDFNEQALRLFRLDRQRLLQLGPGEMSPPRQPDGTSSLEGIMEFVYLAVAGQTPTFEWVHRDAEGREFPCEVRLVRLPSSDRRLVRGSLMDITDRKRAEAQLRAHEEHLSKQYIELEHVYRTAPVGLCLMDTDLRVVRINDELAQINGRPIDQQLGRHLRDVLVGLGDEVESICRRVIQSGQPVLNLEVARAVPPTSVEQQFFLASYHPLMSKDLTVLGVGAVVQDITERKLSEERQRQHEHELTHVAPMSSMDEMVAGIAHEINQPLFAISNFSEACTNVLQHEKKNQLGEVIKWNEEIRKQSLRAGDIMRRLAAFVRHDTPRRSTMELNPLIRDAIALVSFEARRRHVTVRRELQETCRRVLVDGVQIQQVIVNLLRNAYDALEANAQGDRRVTVRTLAGEDGIEVEVEDNGPGYSDETADSLFETFFTTKEHGMGMGLAISRSIITSHSGSLHAYRNKHGGATFVFRLPATNETFISTGGADCVHRG